MASSSAAKGVKRPNRFRPLGGERLQNDPGWIEQYSWWAKDFSERLDFRIEAYEELPKARYKPYLTDNRRAAFEREWLKLKLRTEDTTQ